MTDDELCVKMNCTNVSDLAADSSYFLDACWRMVADNAKPKKLKRLELYNDNGLIAAIESADDIATPVEGVDAKHS